jgi:hypothetical protein
MAASDHSAGSAGIRRNELTAGEPPSWVIGICGVAAVASLLFTVLLFLNR